MCVCVGGGGGGSLNFRRLVGDVCIHCVTSKGDKCDTA